MAGRTKTPAQALTGARKRNMTAAVKALGLLADAVAQHAGLLKDGAVPQASFMTHAVRYDQALTALRTADTALTDGGKASEEDGLIEVPREDLSLLIQVLRAVVPGNMLPEGGPLATLEEALAEDPPWEPEQAGGAPP